MKGSKYIKIILIVSICLIISGVIISAIGYAIGASHYRKNGIYETFEDKITASITDIDISMGAGYLKIVKSDEFKLEANNFRKDSLTYEIKNGKLIIEQRYKWFNIDSIWLYRFTPELTLYVNDDSIFQNIKLDLGAGEINVNNITARNLTIECGAGKLSGENLIAQSSKLSTGVGEINLRNVDFNSLDVTCGAGSVLISGDMKGKISAENGIGEIRLRINGNKGDYYIDANRGIGEISINGSRYNKGEYDHSAPNRINLSNGIGKISVSFE